MPPTTLHRLSAIVSLLRRCIVTASRGDGDAQWLLADVDRMERDLESLADRLMTEAFQTSKPPARCHCGSPRRPELQTCGSDHCRAIAREAKKTIARYHERQERRVSTW